MNSRVCKLCGNTFETFTRNKKCNKCLRTARSPFWKPKWKIRDIKKRLVELDLEEKGAKIQKKGGDSDYLVSFGPTLPAVRLSVERFAKRSQIRVSVNLQNGVITYQVARCARLDGQSRKRHNAYFTKPRVKDWTTYADLCVCDPCAVTNYLTGTFDSPSKTLQIKQWKERLNAGEQGRKEGSQTASGGA